MYLHLPPSVDPIDYGKRFTLSLARNVESGVISILDLLASFQLPDTSSRWNSWKVFVDGELPQYGLVIRTLVLGIVLGLGGYAFTLFRGRNNHSIQLSSECTKLVESHNTKPLTSPEIESKLSTSSSTEDEEDILEDKSIPTEEPAVAATMIPSSSEAAPRIVDEAPINEEDVVSESQEDSSLTPLLPVTASAKEDDPAQPTSSYDGAEESPKHGEDSVPDSIEQKNSKGQGVDTPNVNLSQGTNLLQDITTESGPNDDQNTRIVEPDSSSKMPVSKVDATLLDNEKYISLVSRSRSATSLPRTGPRDCDETHQGPGQSLETMPPPHTSESLIKKSHMYERRQRRKNEEKWARTLEMLIHNGLAPGCSRDPNQRSRQQIPPAAPTPQTQAYGHQAAFPPPYSFYWAPYVMNPVPMSSQPNYNSTFHPYPQQLPGLYQYQFNAQPTQGYPYMAYGSSYHNPYWQFNPPSAPIPYSNIPLPASSPAPSGSINQSENHRFQISATTPQAPPPPTEGDDGWWDNVKDP